MAKRKKNAVSRQEAPEASAVRKPVLSHTAYQIPAVAAVLCFIAQMAMAVMVYGKLPARIPAGWVGYAPPEQTVPRYMVFLVFPAAQVVLFMIAMFSPKDDQGRRVMDRGVSATLLLIALLFAALQASAFRLVGR